MTIINYNTTSTQNPIPNHIQKILDKQYGKNPQYYPVDFSLPEYTSAGQKLLQHGCEQIPDFKGKWVMPYKLAMANWQYIMIQLNNNIHNKDQIVNKGANFINSTKSWFTTPRHLHKINPQFISDYDYSALTKPLSQQDFDKFSNDLKQYLDTFNVNISLNNTLSMTVPKKSQQILPNHITDIILDTFNIKLLGNDIENIKLDMGNAILNNHEVAKVLKYDINKIIHNYGHLIFETDNTNNFNKVLNTMNTNLPDYKIFIRNGMKNFHMENGKLIQDNIMLGVNVKEDTIPLVVGRTTNNNLTHTNLVLSYAANNEYTVAQDLAIALKLNKKQVESILTNNNYHKVDVRIYDNNGNFLHKKVAFKHISNIKRRKNNTPTDFSHKSMITPK